MADTEQINRAGILAVSAKLTDMGWAVREQMTSDFGIDLQAEKLDLTGMGTGRLIAIQVKTGKSYFKTRGSNYVFRGKRRHREYWLAHSLPVFIILHNPETNFTIWQKVDNHLITEGLNGAWSIDMPSNQTVTPDNDQYIAQGAAKDKASIRRLRLALDLDYISTIAVQDNVIMTVDVWVNKSLNYRGAQFSFSEEPGGQVDMEIGAWAPCYTIDFYMAALFPWLAWEVIEYVDESEGSYEVAQWILDVKLNDVGRSALRLEEFYVSELPPFRPDPDGYDESEPIDPFDGEDYPDEQDDDDEVVAEDADSPF